MKSSRLHPHPHPHLGELCLYSGIWYAGSQTYPSSPSLHSLWVFYSEHGYGAVWPTKLDERSSSSLVVAYFCQGSAVGFLLGAWIWGSVADKIGRKKVFFITCGCLFLSGFSCGFSFSYCSFEYVLALVMLECYCLPIR